MLGKLWTNAKKKYSEGEMLEDIYADQYRIVKCLGYNRSTRLYKYEIERI